MTYTLFWQIPPFCRKSHILLYMYYLASVKYKTQLIITSTERKGSLKRLLRKDTGL